MRHADPTPVPPHLSDEEREGAAVCGVDCRPGDGLCNGYCHDNRVKAPPAIRLATPRDRALDQLTRGAEGNGANLGAVECRALLTALSTEREAGARDKAKADAYDRINTPEIADFLSAVENEALHQRERWGVDADGGKEASDWFWLVGYLASKALHDVKGKRLHHLITTAAALLNWHGQETGNYARMRPGSDPATVAA